MTQNVFRTSRRGAALLIVLGALVLATTAAAALVRTVSCARLQSRAETQCALVDEMLRSAEAPIVDWLEKTSASIVLEPDVESPRVEILNDAWTVADVACTLHITAWDQSGMAPVSIARSGSPLRGALPHEVLGVIDRVPPNAKAAPGLDLLRAMAREMDPAVFPTLLETRPIVFGAPTVDDPLADVGASMEAPAPVPPAVGAIVATHGDGRINVNTAPIELVQAALRATGRGGLAQIVEARGQGKLVAASDLPVAQGNERPTGPKIVVASDTWSFRIDVRVGRVQRSWWAVYQKTTKQWECVQRLGIFG